MKKVNVLLFLIVLGFEVCSQSRTAYEVKFRNDLTDVYHLALIAVYPDGKQETRVSDLEPGKEKLYSFPGGTALYLADNKQEAWLMQGNNVLNAGLSPVVVLPDNKGSISVKLSALSSKLREPSMPRDPQQALGTWIIDLRPDPKSDPYLKEFKFTKVSNGRFDGEFYGYPFGGGFLNVNWDRIYFAFTTQDQSGTYFHSGYILGDEVFGITLNEQREFVLPWRGERSKK